MLSYSVKYQSYLPFKTQVNLYIIKTFFKFLQCLPVVGANKDKASFRLPKRGLLTKCQYCTRLCILWFLLVNCPSGGKWLLYIGALVALSSGYDTTKVILLKHF